MAGRGSRFANEGYSIPKPLIEVAGKHMIFWALKSIEHLPVEQVIFICLQEHEEKYQVHDLLSNYHAYQTDFVFIEDVTEGQLCTVLEAKELIRGKSNILIMASDTYIKDPLGKDFQSNLAEANNIISVFDLPGDRWSFAKINDQEEVIEVAEKKRIFFTLDTAFVEF